jgi:hypothetical protein
MRFIEWCGEEGTHTDAEPAAEELKEWGEVVVEEKPYQLIIRPKSVTQLTYGGLKCDSKALQQIIDDVEAGGAVIDDGEPADFDRVPFLTRWEPRP